MSSATASRSAAFDRWPSRPSGQRRGRPALLYNGYNAMRKTLTHIGNSLGLVIEKPILELLGITQENELEITTDGKRLIIEPLRSPRKRRIAESAKRAMD